MAINRFNAYGNYWDAPTAQRPQGGFKNETTPNALDGSYFHNAWVNDWDGYFSSLLNGANMTPNDVPDVVGSSQYYDALLEIIRSVSAFPAGSIQMHGSNTILPFGWLHCRGAAVSRTTYSDLFTVIGTSFGTGDGTTTFNLPDFRGVFPRGYDEIRGIDPGRVFGSYQSDEFMMHSHSVKEGTSGGGGSLLTSGDDYSDDVHTFSDTGNMGGSETRPKNIAVNFIIKT